MSKLKIGDKVKIISNTTGYHEGEVVTVAEVSTHDPNWFADSCEDTHFFSSKVGDKYEILRKVKCMKKYKHVSENEFTKIKTLVDVGFSDSDIAKITKRSGFTVYTIKKSQDLADYKARIRALSQSRKPQKAVSTVGMSLDQKVDHLTELVLGLQSMIAK